MLKPTQQPLVAEIIYLLILPYLNEDPTLVEHPGRLKVLTDLTKVLWNLSRAEVDAEGVHAAARIQADMHRQIPLAGNAITDLLRRSRLVPLSDAPAAEFVSIEVEGEALVITAHPYLPLNVRPTGTH